MVSCTNNKGSHESFLPLSPEPLSLFRFVFYSEIYEGRALVTAHRSDKASSKQGGSGLPWRWAQQDLFINQAAKAQL